MGIDERRHGSSTKESRIIPQIRDDLRNTDIFGNVKREFRELKEFYIDEERQQRLASMKKISRFFHSAFWLLQSLILKLTPTRRIILLIGIILILASNSIDFSVSTVRVRSDTGFAGSCLLLLVLMLELKDKLLARDELQAGRIVQTALMPEQSPVIPGWSAWLFTRTANEVGGDLIDFQQTDERHSRICIADVAGKGLSAALVTTKLQATLRAVASLPVSPEECIKRVNQIFFRDKVRSTFASLVYCEVDSAAPVVRIINAGHLPPLFLTKGSVVEYPKGDAAIGMLPDIPFTCLERSVGKDDILLVYSDGLSEARNPAGEFFGSARIMELLASLGNLEAQTIGHRLLERVDGFIADAPVHDDLSLIILKRTI